ncbi:MAG: aminomethyl-transferring glycine dehydrogenase subunit GcvPA [Candidatus Methanomethylicota archaeon]|uniref:Probable glycine dehydrogenase (decarboxylating) subunit 1 n=1 Tax=Thermoproteota archaeon TaxID=2056631 RepID=A0A497EYY1_9CREN|nr:MAG: aminomethyl-transferring glycine dehydrogenase subunit GcvPA [Candidatus Verstraetearchaeota archaeon]
MSNGKFTHPYLPNSAPKVKEDMLREIGVSDVDELFSDIPEGIRLNRDLNIPGPMSELGVYRFIRKVLSKNVNALEMPVFLGAGCWPHYVPSLVKEIVRRSEFLTSYTPYQPEISQGMLQALFEYQSLICELTGMDVANASMYDWASALAEAALMAVRVTRRSKIVIPKIIHPERKLVLKTYTRPHGIEVVEVQYDRMTGQLDLSSLEDIVSSDVAAVYVENPSYLGFVEVNVEEVGSIAHRAGALYIVGVDPISLGVLKAPGDYGADIVVGEGQPLGNPMNFGGPSLGIFACRGDRRLIRQMPGRIIGMTTTMDGSRRGFVMALQTREQHIRREKATSNICTNEALCAVAAAVYLSLLGPRGLRKLCETILYNSHYAMKRLNDIHGVRAPLFNAPHFKEFVVNIDESGMSIEELHKKLLEFGVHGGKVIKGEFPELGESALYCVTEVHSKEDIDRLVEAFRVALGGGE